MKTWKNIVILVALLAMLSPAAALADDEKPTVAFLRFGQSPAFALTDKGVLDVLGAYGFISEEERLVLYGGGDLRGEHINLLYRDAGFDLATASLMVEDALDEGADVLLTISNQVGMIAVNAISDMDDPPTLIFAIVTAPYDTGLASAPCVKPPNVAGTQMLIDASEFETTRTAQVPWLTTFGLVLDANDPGSLSAEETLRAYADQYGLNIEVATAITITDFAQATNSLLDRGVEAIVLPPRTGSAAGVLGVLDAAYGVPVFSAMVTDVFIGVPFGAGFQGWYREGVIAGRMVAHLLRGELDVARTGISTTPGYAVAVNLDAADAHGVEATQAMLDVADFVIEGGLAAEGTLEIPGVNTELTELTLEERVAADAAFLADLHCSDEMIAEQQAALDATDS